MVNASEKPTYGIRANGAFHHQITLVRRQRSVGESLVCFGGKEEGVLQKRSAAKTFPRTLQIGAPSLRERFKRGGKGNILWGMPAKGFCIHAEHQIMRFAELLLRGCRACQKTSALPLP